MPGGESANGENDDTYHLVWTGIGPPNEGGGYADYKFIGWLFHPQMAQRDFKQVLISIDAETGAELITIIDSDDWVGINKETGKAACLARPTNLQPCSPK